MSQIEASGEVMMVDYAAAVLAKHPARLAALYAPDVRVFDAWGVWSFGDRDAWSRNLQDWLGSLGNEGVRVQFDDVRLGQTSEVGWVSAIVTYSAVNAAGSVLRSMQNRLNRTGFSGGPNSCQDRAMTKRTPPFSAEVRERAARMVLEHQGDHDSRYGAIRSIAAKIGCSGETLRNWVRQAERDQGQRAGPTTDERERIKVLDPSRALYRPEVADWPIP